MKVSINLPESTTIKHVGDETLAVIWKQVAAHPAVLESLAVVGAKTVLTNVWNGGGKDASEAERASAVQKKLDAWYRGEFNVNNRGEAMTTLYREAFRNLLEGAAGKLTDKAFWDAQADVIQAVTNKRPESGKVIPFDVMIESWAARDAKRKGLDKAEVLAKLMARIEADAQALSAERAKALSMVDVTGIDLDI